MTFPAMVAALQNQRLTFLSLEEVQVDANNEGNSWGPELGRIQEMSSRVL